VRSTDSFQRKPSPFVISSRLIGPVGVIARRSTDVTAIDDAEVAKALAYIRDHAFDHELSVDEVVRHSGMSRRSLFTRFQSKLGRTPRKEIERLRLGRAKVILRDTKLTLEQIALRVGTAAPLTSAWRSVARQASHSANTATKARAKSKYR